MPRFQIPGRLNSRIVTDGDEKFIGLDMTRDRALLGPGMLARSENKRLNNGIAQTRPGVVFIQDFNPGFTNQIIGSGVFSDPNGEEVLLVAELNADFVWVLQSGKDPHKESLDTGGTPPTGILNASEVTFVQAFDKVYLFRRPSGTFYPLFWDGIRGNKFKVVALLTGDTDTVIPGGWNGTAQEGAVNWNGEPFQDRLLLYDDQAGTEPWRDQFIMTNNDKYEEYDPATGTFRINTGESNVLTRVLAYFRSGCLVFFRRGIHMIENFTTPDVQIGDQRAINTFLGGVSNQCYAMSGADIHFMSEPGKGIYRIAEAIQEQVAVNPLAVSDPIQPVMDAINWPQAGLWATARALGQYVYWGVPMGETTNIQSLGNNVMLVFNQYTRNWESIDTFADPEFRFHQLHVILVSGERQLLAVDWYRKQIYLMYQGVVDETGVFGSEFPINDVIETRGYTMNDPTSFKRFQRTCFAIQTADPLINLASLSDGFNEVKPLNRNPITKDRLRYYIHGKGRFNPLTDDPNAPKRQDYTPSDITDFAAEDFDALPLGDIQFWRGTQPTIVGNKQQSLERYQIRQNGRWASIRIDNQNGACDVLTVTVDAIPAQEGIKVVA